MQEKRKFNRHGIFLSFSLFLYIICTTSDFFIVNHIETLIEFNKFESPFITLVEMSKNFNIENWQKWSVNIEKTILICQNWLVDHYLYYDGFPQEYWTGLNPYHSLHCQSPTTSCYSLWHWSSLLIILIILSRYPSFELIAPQILWPSHTWKFNFRT